LYRNQQILNFESFGTEKICGSKIFKKERKAPTLGEAAKKSRHPLLFLVFFRA